MLSVVHLNAQCVTETQGAQWDQQNILHGCTLNTLYLPYMLHPGPLRNVVSLHYVPAVYMVPITNDDSLETNNNICKYIHIETEVAL